jgi:protein SCO1/2
VRNAVAALLVAVAVAGCGAARSGTEAVEHPAAPPPSKGFRLKPPAPAPPFTLHDQAGKATGAQDYRGHWFVVAFLYTHCPDVCPLIANNLGAAQRRLPDLRVLAVSVDPKGDTPAAVRAFLRRHHLGPRFRYLTGTRKQLAPVWAAYHVASVGGPKETVSHSAFELLVDPAGKERVLYDSSLHARDVVDDVQALSKK